MVWFGIYLVYKVQNVNTLSPRSGSQVGGTHRFSLPPRCQIWTQIEKHLFYMYKVPCGSHVAKCGPMGFRNIIFHWFCRGFLLQAKIFTLDRIQRRGAREIDVDSIEDALHDIAWYWMVLQSILQYSMIWHGVTMYFLVLYSIFWYHMALYCMARSRLMRHLLRMQSLFLLSFHCTFVAWNQADITDVTSMPIFLLNIFNTFVISCLLGYKSSNKGCSSA